MKLLSLSKFKALSESASDYAISIYLPTHTAGPEIQQDPIRLKNLLDQAEEKLLQAGMSNRDVNQTLQPAYSLLEDASFWRYQSKGLALFLTPQTAEILRLPLAFNSLVTVANRFHLKPLLPLFSSDRYFYVLALSQNQVRFFQATRYQISEVPLEGVPSSLAEALRYDDPEKQLQYHSGNTGSQPLYHGHGVGGDDDKTDIRRFLDKVSNGLHPYLNDEEAPLVIASVEYLQPIYKSVNTYQHLLDEGIQGNPDAATPNELREAAWPKVATLIEQSHQEALAQYKDLQGTNQVSDQVSHLIPAAHRGQVDTLFLLADAHYWGTFDAASGQIKENGRGSSQDCDLLDLAAVQTFLQGGKVYILEADAMPEVPAAAIYRYEVPAVV